MKKLFITIDGVDGVGKTTVTKLLASKNSFQYHKSPCGFFLDVRKEIEQHANPIERYCFFRLATELDSSVIEKKLLNGPVVSDRYILSTAAYHFAMDNRIRIIHNENGLLKPDLRFVLTARSEIRDVRIAQREQVPTTLELDSAFLDKVLEIFMSFENVHFIDTSDINQEEVVEIIEKIIKKYQLC